MRISQLQQNILNLSLSQDANVFLIALYNVHVIFQSIAVVTVYDPRDPEDFLHIYNLTSGMIIYVISILIPIRIITGKLIHQE